ncbi:hypothetical protein QSJ18_07620 [Gordonia sp. ABSL1-1]|uniref:hypothetical protein n=1 Tax=Gordonia sp. ABSL1-1 TaxID=3053923 RepID=UPI0025736419|nr:hypothetical protein [Gordonia sp. ABSL1-1]MDL9936608.1 hypothetical protein [Gordonia sp. ABSL1-1]
MIPPGAHNTPPHPAALPEPPYSTELLADLHAGVLASDVAAHMRVRIAADADAQAVLAALDATQADLADSPVDIVGAPDAVHLATANTLAGLSAPSAPAERPRRSTAWLTAAAAAAVLIIGGLGLASTLGHDDDTAPIPTDPSSPAAVSLDRAAAFRVLGRTDNAPFDSAAAVRRCVAANGVSDSAVVVGSGPIAIDGESAAIILLSTGVAGRFDALVVGLDCDTGNPATITRTIVGAG